MHASTQPQTTEPQTVELPEAFKEKGVFVSLNEKDPFEGIHKAGEAFIQALRDAGFKLSGTHFNITVQPQTTEPQTTPQIGDVVENLRIFLLYSSCT